MMNLFQLCAMIKLTLVFIIMLGGLHVAFL